jgi:hypothetical protein
MHAYEIALSLYPNLFICNNVAKINFYLISLSVVLKSMSEQKLKKYLCFNNFLKINELAYESF